MMRTTDGTIGLMIANAANQGVITHADAECVLEILDAIGSDAKVEIEEGGHGFGRRSLLRQRVDICAGVRDAIEGRIRAAASAEGTELER